MVRAATMTVGGATTLLSQPLILHCGTSRYVVCVPFATRVDVFDAAGLLDAPAAVAPSLEPPPSALLMTLPTTGWPLIGACRIAARAGHPDRLFLLDEEGTINIVSFEQVTPASTAAASTAAGVLSDDAVNDGTTTTAAPSLNPLEVRSHGCLKADATWWRMQSPPSLEVHHRGPAPDGPTRLACNPSGTVVVLYRNNSVLLFDVVTREQSPLRNLTGDIVSVAFIDDRNFFIRRLNSNLSGLISITHSGVIGGKLMTSSNAVPSLPKNQSYAFAGAGNSFYMAKGNQACVLGVGPPVVEKLFAPVCAHESILATLVAPGGEATFILTNRRLLSRAVRDRSVSVIANLPPDAYSDLDGSNAFVAITHVQRHYLPAVFVIAYDAGILVWRPSLSSWATYWYAGRGTCIASDGLGRAYVGTMTGAVRRFAKGATPDVIAEMQLQQQHGPDAELAGNHPDQRLVGLSWLPDSSTLVARSVISTMCLQLSDAGVQAVELHPRAADVYVVSATELSGSSLAPWTPADAAASVVAFRDGVDVVVKGKVVAQWAPPAGGVISHCTAAPTACAATSTELAYTVVASHGHDCSVLRLVASPSSSDLNWSITPTTTVDFGKEAPAALCLLAGGWLIASFFGTPNALRCWSLRSDGADEASTPLELPSVGDKNAVVTSMHAAPRASGVVVAATNFGHVWVLHAAQSKPPRSIADPELEDEVCSIALPSATASDTGAEQLRLWAWLLDGTFGVAPLVAVGWSARDIPPPPSPTIASSAAAAADPQLSQPAAYLSVLVVVPGLAAAQFTVGCAAAAVGCGRGSAFVPLPDDVEEIEIDVRPTAGLASVAHVQAFGSPAWALSGSHTDITLWKVVDRSATAVAAYSSQRQVAPRGSCVRALCSMESKQRTRFAVVSQPFETHIDEGVQHWPPVLHLVEAWNPDIKTEGEVELDGDALAGMDALCAVYEPTANVILVGGAKVPTAAAAPAPTVGSPTAPQQLQQRQNMGGAIAAAASRTPKGLLAVVTVDPLRVATVLELAEPVLSLSAAAKGGAVFAACGSSVLCWRSADFSRPVAEWNATLDGGAVGVASAPGGTSGEYHCSVACGLGLRILRLVRSEQQQQQPSQAPAAAAASSPNPTSSATNGTSSAAAAASYQLALLTKDPTLSSVDMVAPFASYFRVNFNKLYAATADGNRNVYVSELPVSGKDVRSAAVRKTVFGAAVRLQAQPVASTAVDRAVMGRAGSASWYTPMPLSAFEVPASTRMSSLLEAMETEKHPARDPRVAVFLRRKPNRDTAKGSVEAFCAGPLASGVLKVCRDGSVVNIVPLGSRFADVATTLEAHGEGYLHPEASAFNEIGELTRPELALRSAAENARRIANHGRKSVGVSVVNADTIRRMECVVPTAGADESFGDNTPYACDEALWKGVLQPAVDKEYPLLGVREYTPLREVLMALHAVCS